MNLAKRRAVAMARWRTKSKPLPSCEILTEIREPNGARIHFYPATPDMEERLVAEISEYGYVAIKNHCGLYALEINPLYDIFEVAQYLGRGGTIEVTKYGHNEPLENYKR